MITPIDCNDIQATITYLLAQFQTCSRLEADDMQLLVNLVHAVDACSSGNLAQDNLFREIDLGTMNTGDSPASLANALALYTITETDVVIYTATLNLPNGNTRELRWVTLLKGKNTYGTGGQVTLIDDDFLMINPNQNTSSYVNDGEDGFNPFISLADLYTGNSVINGGVIWLGTGMDYYVWATRYIIDNVTYSGLVFGTVTLSDAPNANSRIDRFVVASDTKPTGTVTLTGGGSGSVDSITVGGGNIMSGAVNFNTDLATTATDVVNDINSGSHNYVASNIGAVITIRSKRHGILDNGAAIVSNTTTITTTDVAMSGGLDTVLGSTSNSSVGVITGFAELSPVAPDVATNEAIITFKIVLAGETVPTGTQNILIYDENAGNPTEWIGTNSGGWSPNFTDAVNPGANTVSLQLPSVVGTPGTPQLAIFSAGAGTTLPYDDNATLNFLIRTDADWTNRTRFKVRIKDSGAGLTAAVNFTRNGMLTYGFSHTQTNVWQRVSIPISQWNQTLMTTIDGIEFEPSWTDSILINIDDIFYQTGGPIPPPSGGPVSFLDLTDTPNSYSGGESFLVKVKADGTGLEFTNDNHVHEAYTESGARNLNNVQATIGDHDSSGQGTRLNVNDATQAINAYATNGLSNNVGNNGASLLNGLLSAWTNTENIDVDAVNMRVVYGGAAGTTNLSHTATATRNINYPDGSGTLLLTVNGVGPDTAGNVVLPTDFISLDDTPANYTGSAGYAVVVNGTEDGVEFTPFDLSPFEKLDEGNGDGYIIRGSNRTQAASVGAGAFDFGYYFAIATQGASGTYAVNLAGEDCLASNYGSIVLGGYENTSSGIYGVILGGSQNTVSDPYCTTGGYQNEVIDYGGIAWGNNLKANDANTVVVGQSNVDNTPVPGINGANQRRFVVGNGDVNAGAPPTANTRSDAFVVYHDGRLMAPSLSISDITGATNDVLITKEYLAQEVAKAEIGFAASDETTDLAVGPGQLTFRMPFAMTLDDVIITLNTGPAGSTFICDVLEDGTSILSTLVSIDAEIAATGTVTCVSATAAQTVTVNGLVYTAVAGAKADNTEFSIDTSDTATATDLADSITNDNRTPVTETGTDTTATSSLGVVTITATVAGAIGNNVDLSSSNGTTLAVSGANLAGGVTEETSDTAATPVVISDSSLAKNAEISVDVTQVGSTAPGTGLKVWLIGSKT